MYTLSILMSMISILISVAFYTIMERKFLSYIQIRKGPNKTGFMGIFQPFSDAIKLFNKTLVTSEAMNMSIAWAAPPLTLCFALMLISITPFSTPNFDNKHNILLFFIISSLTVYSMLMVGWSSNSKYAHMGAIRGIAQMISYEVSFFLIILFIALMSQSYNFLQISQMQLMLPFLLGNSILFTMWFISCLAEVNRSPFDFAEGESELVSGFNIEYMGGWFALIFLAEYMNMLILSIISTTLFIKWISLYTMPFTILLTIVFLWVRGSYPRFRYDMLMYLNWKFILPSILLTISCPMMLINI